MARPRRTPKPLTGAKPRRRKKVPAPAPPPERPKEPRDGRPRGRRNYDRADMQRAMMLYAAGKGFEEIARIFSAERGHSMSGSTVQRWYDKQYPDDWDKARVEFEAKAAAEGRKRMLRERARMTVRQFDDLEMLRAVVKQAVVMVESEGEDGKKKRKIVIREGLSARDIRAMVAAYKDIAQMERLILGLATERIADGEDSEAAGVVVLPAELLEADDDPDEEEPGGDAGADDDGAR
jgi:hypothetical protein